jgi:hypothetical protein
MMLRNVLGSYPGVLLYNVMPQEPEPGEHRAFVAEPWKM